ncbi:hypothetical protein CO676_18425 [Sinorhizobium sp. BJ1]|nr:hypothetical protein CO676_18425 [Sinorhizobium sp. BJ1]
MGYQRGLVPFSCNEVTNAVELQEQRSELETLVRAYGEVLALFSFMHLGLREPGMNLLFAQLSCRAADILESVGQGGDRRRRLAATEHAARHLGRARSDLLEVQRAFEGRLGRQSTELLRLLTRASLELKRASALLGTMTFDASGCCAGPLFANAEETHGSAFRLGA